MKHTSTVLEPSNPFHTLVKLVEAEDIANEKIRTLSYPRSKQCSKKLETQTLDTSKQE